MINGNEGKEYFIHVRSHRQTPVPLNSKADFYAGSIAAARLGEVSESKKCGTECTKVTPCAACSWNQKINFFVRNEMKCEMKQYGKKHKMCPLYRGCELIVAKSKKKRSDCEIRERSLNV